MWWPMVILACVASATSPAAEKRDAAIAAAGPGEDVSILKQINKVNDDGSYTFGYEASDGSFKVETRDVAGNVKGMFGFVDETGRLKRVSYSASNSSGFRTAATGSTPVDSTASPVDSTASPVDSTASPSSVQTIPPRKTPDDHAAEPDKSAAAVKKVLVSRRPVAAPELQQDETGRPRDGNDPRRQLSGNDDVPVSPVVSALMSELDPVGASYREREPSYREREPSYVEREPSPYVAQQDSISRRAQEEYEPPPPQYRQRLQRPAHVVYGPDLTALRDELLELILYFVQTRVSRIVSVPTYQPPLPPPLSYPMPYPMPYQQPNYYVPSYYQGPRMPSAAGFVVRQDGHAEQPSPTVTQTLKDGLIRMLLSTSPRYGPERIVGQPYAYRSAARSTPVRNVQIVGDDGDADTVRPVTTETPAD